MLIDGKEYTNQQLVQAAELFPYTWCLQHKIKTSNGLPFEFTNHKFLKAMINDMSPLQVWLKPPQIGASETQIIKAFYVAKKKKKDIIYTLPTATDRDDMVGSKVNRIIAQNAIFQAWVKDHDTVEQKTVGSNIIHYRGTFAAKQAMMVSSDLNIHDEVDASDPDVITQYETRLQAQADGWRWYFSHPSLSGHGVDIYWQQSDKKEWHISCPGCSMEQVLTWPDNINLERKEYTCSHCKGTLTDDVRREGKWKATGAGPFSGYHVSQLMCPWISAAKIIEAYDDPMKDKQYFWNYVLGLPYMESDDKIDPSMVLRNCVEEANGQEGNIVIGVDTGLPIHYVVANKDGIFYYDTCVDPSTGKDPYDQLDALLKRWKKAYLVSDQGGDLIGIRKLQAKHPGRIFLCYYRKDRKTQQTVTWEQGEKYGEVIVDRNRMLQLIVEQFKEIGRFRLNGSKEEWAEFAAHFGNIYREKIVVKELKDKDDKTLYGNEYVWKRSGPDHYVHALLYTLIGLDKFGTEMAKILSPDIMGNLRTGQVVNADGFVAASFGQSQRIDI